MRLSEELARILPARRRRRPADRAPREIVPAGGGAAGGADAAAEGGPCGAALPARAHDAGRFDAARERLRAEIPPRDRG